MEIQALCETIDLSRHDLSLLLVEPRKEFRDWFADHSSKKGISKYRLMPEEENTAIVIPKIDRFTEPGSFEKFIAAIKPSLLRGELTRVRASPQEFGHAITAETFDRYFCLKVRSFVFLVTDFKDVKL